MMAGYAVRRLQFLLEKYPAERKTITTAASATADSKSLTLSKLTTSSHMRTPGSRSSSCPTSVCVYTPTVRKVRRTGSLHPTSRVCPAHLILSGAPHVRHKEVKV